MHQKFEHLLDTLKHAISYDTKRTRSSLIESLFHLFGNATNHTIARILTLHNTEVQELLNTWQAKMGGLMDESVTKAQARVSQLLNMQDIDNYASNRDCITVDAASVVAYYETITPTESCCIELLLAYLRDQTPEYKYTIHDSSTKGEFIIEVKKT